MDFPTTVMETLKGCNIDVMGTREFGGANSPAQAQYCLTIVEDNLVMPMSKQDAAKYNQGNGNELEGKMKPWLVVGHYVQPARE